MKEGRTLVELAQELERQRTVAKDYLADTRRLKMVTCGVDAETDVAFQGLNGVPLLATDHAHTQVAARLDIPRAYYNRMRREAPRLLSSNVNTWMETKPETRLFRTLDGKIRAVLSDRYRHLDNFELANSVLPTLVEKGAKIVSSELTEFRMYIKAVLPEMKKEVEGSKIVGDIVQAGIVISNSEVGAGSLRVEPFVYRLVCLNGMIAADNSFKKYHIGRGYEAGESVRELLAEETRRLDDKVFWMKVGDIVNGAFDKEIFEAMVNRMSVITKNKITSGDIPGVVEVTAKTYGFSTETQNSILRHLIEGGDLSQWGLLNAVTETANHAESYELATDLERAGGKILELNAHEWQKLAA